VFNRFSKLDTFVPGNGLGLYLCRLIVKRLDGEIKIDPDYTEGTRVIVNLPKHE
jgi:signal transduction histidine kinase